MSFRIDRTRRAVSARQGAPAGTDRKSNAHGVPTANLPVPVGPVIEVHRPDNRDHAAALDAQLLGQDGQKRGLRGGQTVLDQARQAYNSVEWSGRYDRRARTGRLARDVA
jgi:hypothetical protein